MHYCEAAIYVWEYSVTEKCELKDQRAIAVAFMVEEAERWFCAKCWSADLLPDLNYKILFVLEIR